jgi:hypothetical protein
MTSLSAAAAAAAPIASAAASAGRDPEPPDAGVPGEAELGDIGADFAAVAAAEPLFGKALSLPGSVELAPGAFGFRFWLAMRFSGLKGRMGGIMPRGCTAGQVACRQSGRNGYRD